MKVGCLLVNRPRLFHCNFRSSERQLGVGSTSPTSRIKHSYLPVTASQKHNSMVTKDVIDLIVPFIYYIKCCGLNY